MHTHLPARLALNQPQNTSHISWSAKQVGNTGHNYSYWLVLKESNSKHNNTKKLQRQTNSWRYWYEVLRNTGLKAVRCQASFVLQLEHTICFILTTLFGLMFLIWWLKLQGKLEHWQLAELDRRRSSSVQDTSGKKRHFYSYFNYLQLTLVSHAKKSGKEWEASATLQQHNIGQIIIP